MNRFTSWQSQAYCGFSFAICRYANLTPPGGTISLQPKGRFLNSQKHPCPTVDKNFVVFAFYHAPFEEVLSHQSSTYTNITVLVNEPKMTSHIRVGTERCFS